MVSKERRRAKRFLECVPIRVQPVRASVRTEESTECLNISISGVYFPTRLQLHVGSELELRFTMPEQVIPGHTRECSFLARVVHVEALGSKSGVGAQFLYYSAA